MVDQTQSYSSPGIGRTNTSSYGMDSGQSDAASASSRLRVRVAGTALFTVGLAALGYSMVDKSMEGNDVDGTSNGEGEEVAEHVQSELPEDYLVFHFDNNIPNTPGTPDKDQPPPPPPPPTQPVHDHSLMRNGLHDFSGCGTFSQAFAHARAEFGRPGEIFIYHGKPYTTTYKHELEHIGHVHVKQGLEVVLVVSEDENGNRILAADTDGNGKVDSWFFENNHSKYLLVDSDGDGKLDSYVDKDSKVIYVSEPIDTNPDSVDVVPPPVVDVMTIDGVQFLAFGSPGEYTEIMGEYNGTFIFYRDADGDGTFDHAATLDKNLHPIKEWEIDPVTLDEIDVDIFDSAQPVEPGSGGVITDTEPSGGLIGPPEDDGLTASEDIPIIDDKDQLALDEDPYRIDAENEINSGSLNNHANMADFGN